MVLDVIIFLTHCYICTHVNIFVGFSIIHVEVCISTDMLDVLGNDHVFSIWFIFEPSFIEHDTQSLSNHSQ